MRTRSLYAALAVIASLFLGACSQPPDPTPPPGATTKQQLLQAPSATFAQNNAGVTGSISPETLEAFSRALSPETPLDGNVGLLVTGEVHGLNGRSLYLIDIGDQAFFAGPAPATADGPFEIEDVPIGGAGGPARKMSFELRVVDANTPAAAEFAKPADANGERRLNPKALSSGSVNIWSGVLYVKRA